MFLKFDMRQGHKGHSDMRHDHFINSTGDMGINKRQILYTTLAFLKIDRRHGHRPSRAPIVPPPDFRVLALHLRRKENTISGTVL